MARIFALLTGAVLGLTPLLGAAVDSLRSYTAEYDTSALGMHLTLHRELKGDGEGGYTLTNGGKILVAGFHEVAVFSVREGEVIPKSYVYQGTGLINRRREVHITPGADTLRSLYKGEWYELPNKPGTLDRLSQQEHLRLLMLSDPNPRDDLVITVADGRKVKDYKIEFVGEETVETAVGPVKTLHFARLHDDPDRSSEIWVAPDWDYLMVKTVHVEDDKPVEVLLTKASIDGVPVGSDADN
ncbi:DUF3108 domain-containing protein [Parahaliea mediterranea]|uniref:DUF3108 domain-containing protein n=1 Tax=Parahaliea mediterranea TaxID=651086 RepID=UPI001F4E3F6C|nr:DUF3108 domain-containing protein [Parahaliea mediterranea]